MQRKKNLQATTKTIDHHIINSLKRINFKMKQVNLITTNNKSRLKVTQHSSLFPVRLKRSFNKSNNLSYLSLMIFLFCFISEIFFIVTHCDVSTFCPKDLTPIYPCSCQNGTQGLLIKCAKLNLAALSNSMKILLNSHQSQENNYEQSIEQLEIENGSISKLFGPLFKDSSSYKFHSSLRELDIRASGLKTIDANSFSPELSKSIQYLMFDRNYLQQVPIELINNMTNLKLLNLSTNLISSIEMNAFTKLTNLTELDLSRNKIAKIANSKSTGAFNSLTNLEYLNLNDNELTKLEKNLFSFGRKLRHLDLSNNKLISLDRQDFNELTGLETLKISNNQLTTIPRSIFSRNAKLYSLDLSYNKLEDIDTYLLKSVRFLRDLNIAGNVIKEITKNTFSPTTRIKRINMSSNALQALGPETFKGLEWLELIDLSHNQIVNISNDAFNRIFSVEIDLSHNKLMRIFYWAFHEVAKITKLNLSHNFIDEGISLIAFESTDCDYLDLSYNQIEDISKVPVGNLTGIKVLDLSHNQITEFNKKSFGQKAPLYELHTIDASYNNISSINGNILEKLKSIRFFNISNNSLRRLTSGAFGNSPTLLKLDLSHNNLVEVVSGTLVGLVSLKSLNIGFNRLKKMIPIPVALNSIQLEHNEISQLSRSAFPSLNSLLELDLSHNRINHIEEGTFATLLALHTLNLGHNNISSIPASALKDLSSLQWLSMEGNSIQRLSRKAFGVLPIVFHLRLDQNNISSIANHAFDGLLQLLTLNLSHNNLLELNPETFFSLVSLRDLDLSNNQLNRFENKTKSAMEDLLSLEVANFSSNKLSVITSKSFLSSPYIPYKLRRLDLSNNLIGIIANNFANGFKKLEWLSLRNNIINEIYPNVLGNASSLKYLDLSNNKLRTLKEETFSNELVNLTTLLLSNNKLTGATNSIQAIAHDLDKLRNLIELDLSANRLDRVQAEFIRWIKSKGMILDLRNNQNLECSCELLPFLAWLDSVAHRQTQQSNANNIQTGNLLSKYLQAASLINNLTCARPDLLSGQPMKQLIELAGSIELNCDKTYQDEADSFKRLKAPIQFNGAEPYYYEGEQFLKIGWTLVDTQLNLNNFNVLMVKFQQPPDMSLYHSKLMQQVTDVNQNQNQNQNQNVILEQTLERISYDQRTHLLRNLDSSAPYVICLTYEATSPSSSSSSTSATSVNLQQSPSTLLELFLKQPSMSLFNAILTDYTRINCVELNSLLKNDFSDKLVSEITSSASSLLHHSSPPIAIVTTIAVTLVIILCA